ncbi:hypothetical protein BJH93_04045 [Kocuria polaris]|nr:hypothetical protein [Kocuria polaris]
MKFIVTEHKSSRDPSARNVYVKQIHPDGRRETWELLMTDVHTTEEIRSSADVYRQYQKTVPVAGILDQVADTWADRTRP